MRKLINIFLLSVALVIGAGNSFGEESAVFFTDASIDSDMQDELYKALQSLKLDKPMRKSELSIALVDITDENHPRLAAFNGSKMFYAASLPKIAILLGAFHKSEHGQLDLTPEVIEKLTAMIRYSSNAAATEMMNLVGMQYIADMLQSGEYRFYDPSQGGGLWLGKEYAKKSAWKRDPLHNLSHGATALQVAKFYYMLATNQLLSAESCSTMLKIMGNPGISHKFVRGLAKVDKDARIYRKSGSWHEYHSDSALIERRGHRYIAVGLTKNRNGGRWLQNLIVKLDSMIVDTRS